MKASQSFSIIFCLKSSVVNNKIYAIGGLSNNNDPLSTVEEYDPVTDRWVTRKSLPTSRAGLAVGVVNDKIYAIGGGGSESPSVAVEESSFTVSDTTPPADVANFTASPGNGQISLSWTNPSDSDLVGIKILRKTDGYPTSPTDGTVIYDGTGTNYTDTGLTNGMTYYYMAFAYDEVPNYSSGARASETPRPIITWVTKASMQTGRFGLAIGVVNNKIYAIGGCNKGGCSSALTTVEEYDPATDQWTTKAPMPTGREGLAIGVVNNKIYAIGGTADPNSYLATVEEYDPATDQWITKTPMPTARSGLAIGVVNNKIYAIGGLIKGSGILARVEEYDPVANQWTTKTPMPTARWKLTVGVVGGKTYAIGGGNGISTFAIVEEYDPATDQWTTKAPMPAGRQALAVGVVKDKIYAIGGCCKHIVGEYDPETDQWLANTPMPTDRWGLAIGVVNNKIYAIGGASPGAIDTVEEGTFSP